MKQRLFEGVFAIFGHGNVAGLGEALYAARESLPTYRAHNEQAMAHAAIAFAKASRRKRMMACTTSIGPGATNMVTAAAVAHVNRLPVLLIPGDVFANRRPDPVLQQVEDFGDGTVSANDCFKPVSRYFDRITRPEQIVPALNRAVAVLTDPAECGPVTLAFCQDVQAEAYDYPASFFDERVHRPRRIAPDPREVEEAAALLKQAKKPFVDLRRRRSLFRRRARADRLLRQARGSGRRDAGGQVGDAGRPSPRHGRGRRHRDRRGQRARGGGGRDPRRRHAVRRLHHRLVGAVQESRPAVHRRQRAAVRRGQASRVAGRRRRPRRRSPRSTPRSAPGRRRGRGATRAAKAKAEWEATAARYTAPTNAPAPTDAEVLGALMRAGETSDVVVCAAGGLPGELHKLWRAGAPLGYHVEYGYSCMGYEIAGGLGVKMALPEREVVVIVGDGSYLMMNSEIATSVMLGLKLIIVVLDNRGFGCINRLQQATGGAPFNNLLRDARHETLPEVDFVAHARALGAEAVKVNSIAELEAAFKQARAAKSTQVIVIDTDPIGSTDAGGFWWDVAVPAVSERKEVGAARTRLRGRAEAAAGRRLR